MTKKEKAFYESCIAFKSYGGLDEYIEDIRKCLMLSDWHYSEQQANERIEENRSFIETAFNDGEPALSAAANAGYCCG